MSNWMRLCAVLLVGWMPATQAGEGAIPLFEPTTIDTPGVYVVTRNIQATDEPVITVTSSAGLVRIEINGFILWRTDGGGPVIDVETSPERPNVELLDGEVGGGQTGINGGDHVSLLRVGFYDQFGDGLDLGGVSSYDVVDCTIANSGGRGIVAQSSTPSKFIGNIVRDTGSTGVELTGQGGIIRDNSIQYAQGTGLSIVGGGYHLSGNIVRTTQVGAANGDGIYVDGFRNLIENNVSADNGGYGVVFAVTGGTNNAYRGNMLLGNVDGAVGGPTNRDEGGNIQ